MSNSESLSNGQHSSNVSNNGSITTNNNRHFSPPKAIDEMKTLKLQSPAGGNPLTFQYNPADVKKHLVGFDILDTIRMAMTHFSELNTVIQSHCKIEDIDPKSYSDLKSLCKKFNKAASAMSQMWKDTMSAEGGSADLQQMAHKDLLRALVNRSYNRAVENEKALNKHYEAFSSQTYGETSYDRMQMILDEIQPTNKDVFVDLGSGVGQLVVHVAGGSQVSKAIGIEIAQLPSRFATTLESEFKKWMSWFGKKYQHFELHHGDFLDEKFRELITQEASVIFINNYAFTSDLETRIKLELLSELRDGVRIISTKPYVPVNKNSINDRQMNDISVIIDVVEMKRCANPCSWTSADVPYYMHTINRAKLERYFFSGRARSNDGSRRSSTPSSKASNSRAPSRESSVGVREREYNCRQTNGYHHMGGTVKAHSTNGEEIGYGPTTRRKWNEYVSELHKRKKDGSSEDGLASTSKAESVILYRHTPLQINFDNQPQSSNSVNEFSFELINSPPAAETTTSNDRLSLERDTNSPAKKRPKRSYEKKEKTRGRPRKSDPQGGQGHHSNHKNPRLSDEAKEGIELMHEMTKAVASGSNIDGVNPALILADLTNQRQKKKILNNMHAREAMALEQTTETSPPIMDGQQAFLQIPFPALPGTSNASTSRKFEENSRKYPNLDKFLGELRHLYENFFDSVHTPEFLQGMVDKVSAERTKNELYINTADAPFDVNLRQKMNNNLNTNLLERIQEIHAGKLASDPSNRNSTSLHFVERSRKILEHHKRIRTKCAEMEAEIALLNDETEQLLNEYQQREEEDRQNRQAQQRELRFQEQQQAQQQQQLIAAQQQANALAAATQQQVSQQLVAAAAQQLTGNGGMFAPALEQITLSDLAHYSQQIGMLNSTPLLSQIQSHLSILNSAAPYDQLSAALQALTGGGMALPSPLAGAQTSALHSPVVGAVQQQQQMTAVQNFLSTNLGLELNALGQNATTATLNTELNALNNSACAGTNLNVSTSAIQHQQLAAAIVASEAAQPPRTPVSSVSINSALVSSSTPATAQITDEIQHSSSVAAVVAAVAAGHKDAKKSTPRKSSSKTPTVSSANKSRSGPNPKNAGQVEDPAKQEEIERQIQDIVERCLEVDSAAKCAEKERKARSGDRKREKSNSVASTSADSLSSNKKRSSTDSISNFIPPTTPTVSTSADFVAPSLNNFVSAAAASAAALLQNANNANRTVEAKSESPVFTFAPSSVSLAISAATLQPQIVGNSIESAQEARPANMNSSPSTYMTSYIPLSAKTRMEQANQQQNPVLSPISPNFSPNFPTTPTPSSSSSSFITIKQEPQSVSTPQCVSALDESILQTIKKHTAS